jgi:H+-translocating NAD(P) transhydrogenase subunit alpha
MPIKVAVPIEIAEGENRVAIDPSVASRYAKLGLEVVLEKGAGVSAHMVDEDFGDDVSFVSDSKTLYKDADIILKVQPPSEDEIKAMKEGAIVIGTLQGYKYPERVALMRDRKITSFSMELIPRISRAQAMDVLSSQAAVAGYKAAIMGSDLSCRFFPMLTTAAGTIRPAKVLVIGAGVAGLQAVATAKRLGAMVEGYDVRSATKEQVESLGAKFIELSIKAEGEGGYARELTDEEKKQQQDELAEYMAKADVLITTASVPGRPAPKIIPESTVKMMKHGAVLIDLAAESGGNCELTEPGKTIVKHDVIIHAPLNVPSQTPFHASEMYAKNLFNFLSLMFDEEGNFSVNWDDEVIAESALTHEGEIKHEATRTLVEGGQS